jgi:hypothetical protein
VSWALKLGPPNIPAALVSTSCFFRHFQTAGKRTNGPGQGFLAKKGTEKFGSFSCLKLASRGKNIVGFMTNRRGRGVVCNFPTPDVHSLQILSLVAACGSHLGWLPCPVGLDFGSRHNSSTDTHLQRRGNGNIKTVCKGVVHG